MAGVLCVGIAAQDYVFAVPEMPTTLEKHRAKDFALVGGGIAATASVAVARLGGMAMLATRLGQDEIGNAIIADLRREGVDCSLARQFAGHRSSLSAVLVTDTGERCVINYGDATIPDDEAWLPSRLPTGIGAVMGDTRWERGSKALFLAARASGGVGVLDADRAPQDPELIAAATHVAFATQALRELTGIADPAKGLAAVAQGARNWLAVTDGAAGTWYTAGGEIRHVPAFPITPVDTLGAGDVFHGALALGLAEGQDDRSAVRFASAAAAIKCTRFGGRAGIPTRQELDAFMARHQGGPA